MASTAALGAFGAGSLAFWTFFHRGEHFEYGVRYIQLTLVSVFAGTIFLSSSTNITPTKALAASSRFAGIFLAGVYINCIAYRLFLNPLNSIPGPFLARLSKLNHAFQNKGFTAHHTLLEMHERYGKFVRVGPNDVSVSDVDGIEVISSAKSKCTKSPWYGQDGQSSLQQTRDRAFHDRRRRVWAPAFSDKAIRGYETRVQTYNDLLISKLAESEGQPINATNILNLYSFDTMGDLAFGKDFGMLEKGDVHWAIKILTDGLDALGLQLPHWILPLALAIPGALKEILQLVDFCTAQLKNRIAVHDKTDPERRDITHTLIDHYQKSDDQKQLWPVLCGDTRLIVVAGSDTTAATLTHFFYHFASKPEWQKKLRDELQQIRADNETTERAIPDLLLKDAPILNGMVHETLRLNPPVPSGVFRITPAEGVMIGRTFIAGNTNIQIPQYVLSRSPDYFVDPLSFIPERWSTKPELVKQKDAYAPFSTGPYNCIGKNLALMEVRTITSQIVDQFDVSFAPGEDGSTLLMKTRDHFTLGLAELRLCFWRRA